MHFPIHTDTISMDLSILYYKGSQVEILILFLSLFILVNSAYSDEICIEICISSGLPKNSFRGLRSTKKQSTKQF